MSLRNENTKGWIGTIIVHLLLAIVLFLWKLDLSASQPEYIEVSLGSIAQISTSSSLQPSVRKSVSGPSAPVVQRSKSVDLPERRFSAAEEVLRLPPTTKMSADAQPSKLSRLVAGSSGATKDRGARAGGEGSKKLTARDLGGNAGEVADPIGSGNAGSGNPGSEIGKAIAVSMQWSDGGNRKKISGALPEYPPGVKVESQIRIELTVQPDGSVKSLRPAQKGNMKLEEAAMKETRFWRFEPLGKSLPQLDQACVVTFNFQLR